MEYEYPFYETGSGLPEGLSLDDYRHEYYKNNRNTGAVVEFTVLGGTDGTQPTFDGDPLFSGSYVRIGSVVHFEIQVDFDNITSFGTGQYYVSLPFASRYAYILRDGCLHDNNTGDQFHISGHVAADSDVLELYSSDKVSSGVEDKPFTATSPFTLATADNFHIAGMYIAAAS